MNMTLAHGHAQSVIDAIHTLHARFAEPVRMEELASMAQMSLSAFYRQFKAITSMMSLQYLKQLRLLEARRLIETDAFDVGYESPSQFGREYSRMFRASPWRDVSALRVMHLRVTKSPATHRSSRRLWSK